MILRYVPRLSLEPCHPPNQLFLTREKDVAVFELQCRAEYVQAELVHPLEITRVSRCEPSEYVCVY